MEKELLRHLEYLTGICPFRNFGNPESLKVASDYIDRQFENYGFEVQHQKWNYGKFEYTNIIAPCQPRHKKRLLVEGPGGMLWIGRSSQGLLKFDPDKGTFQKVVHFSLTLHT